MPASDLAPSVQALVDRLVTDYPSVHAVLFYGAEGAGMETAARMLAKRLLCTEPLGPDRAYDCAVCRSFEAGRMVDLHHVKPWGPMSLIKIDAVRPPTKFKKPDEEAPKPSLIEFFRTSPLMARHKVALFEQAERMNHDASNALLKTLEEPPPFAKVILTTSEFSRLLPTVRSRCMAVACPASATVEPDDMVRVFGGTQGLDSQVREHEGAYRKLWDVCESALAAPPYAAIALAERTREASEAVGKALKVNARAGNAETLRCLASWLAARRPDRPELAQSAVEVHRFILGNVNTSASLDWLWVEYFSR